MNGNLTIPNFLTVFRILFTPMFVALFLDQDYAAALSLFFLAGLTDALDGFLARILNQRSTLGAILDPLADKVLLDSSYVCLALSGWLPVWLAVAVVSRDVIILGGLALLSFWGLDMRKRIKPSMVSKTTTAFQMGLILLAFAVNLCSSCAGLLGLQDGVAVVTGVLTAASGCHYVWLGLRLLSFSGHIGNGDSKP